MNQKELQAQKKPPKWTVFTYLSAINPSLMPHDTRTNLTAMYLLALRASKNGISIYTPNH